MTSRHSAMPRPTPHGTSPSIFRVLLSMTTALSPPVFDAAYGDTLVDVVFPSSNNWFEIVGVVGDAQMDHDSAAVGSAASSGDVVRRIRRSRSLKVLHSRFPKHSLPLAH